MTTAFNVSPIGIIHKKESRTWIEIHEPYADGLLGLDGFSHIHVLFWFHENDNPESRKMMQVHPRRDPKNPLTGVFATHSPHRPNLIGLTRCRVLSINGLEIHIEEIDARNDTPVLDIKCYIPRSKRDKDVFVPGWV